MYKINFNHLHYFLTIAKEGSIVRASKVLNITQPALSHQLKILEQDLGKKLFDRNGKRLVINKSGEAVKEYASKIFRHSEEMIQVLKSDKITIIKIIKIGTVPWISKDQIYQFIKPLVLNKHIKIEVHHKDLESLIKDVQNNRMDIILCDAPYSGRSKKLQGHLLRTDQVYCVSSKKLASKEKFPENLNGTKIVTYSDSCILSDQIDNFLFRNKIILKKFGEFSDSSLIRIAAENGAGIAFLPKTVVKRSIKDKKLFKLGELTDAKFSLWAITRKGNKRDSLISETLAKFKRS